MGRKIAIIVFLVGALIFTIIQPGDFATMGDDLVKYIGGSWFAHVLSFIIMFYISSTVVLFWVGIPAGWVFARDMDWGIFGIFVSVYIGMLISLPIAIYQLFRSY